MRDSVSRRDTSLQLSFNHRSCSRAKVVTLIESPGNDNSGTSTLSEAKVGVPFLHGQLTRYQCLAQLYQASFARCVHPFMARTASCFVSRSASSGFNFFFLLHIMLSTALLFIRCLTHCLHLWCSRLPPYCVLPGSSSSGPVAHGVLLLHERVPTVLPGLSVSGSFACCVRPLCAQAISYCVAWLESISLFWHIAYVVLLLGQFPTVVACLDFFFG